MEGIRKSLGPMVLAGGMFLFAGPAAIPALGQAAQIPDSGIPVFRVDVVARTTKVVNFHHRQGSTEMDLRPTSNSPRAEGWVKIDSREGATRVSARVDKLNPPQSHGDEYLTYVLWAITPEGRPENLGELSLDGGDEATLQAATELQSFGMIVTAEPYYAVTQPSDVVVMEAAVGKNTTGTITALDAKYELWPKGMYAKRLPEAHRTWSRKTGKEAPPALNQAKHALAIAKSVDGERYAADTIKKAETDLYNAEAYFNNKGDLKRIQTLARNVTQLAEDARLIAIKRAGEERLEAERLQAEARVSAAQTAAEQEARKRELAESERRLALEREQNARLRAEQEERQRQRLEQEKTALADARRAAEQARAAAEAEALKAGQNAEEARARAAAAAAQAAEASQLAQQAAEQRAAAEAARQAAETEQEKLRAQQAIIAAEAEQARALAAEAERKRIAAEQAQQLAVAEQDRLRQQREQFEREAAQARSAAAKADLARQEAEAERTRMREQLRNQLNAILVTKETARGLILSMSDVLFETAKHTLRPGAREKLARIGGILTTHPELKLEVEGHTDSVGAEQYNQALSERRAASVREFLVAQGVRAESISSAGFGESRPVADNISAAGRQQNRRVEIVVSGESIQTRVNVQPVSSVR